MERESASPEFAFMFNLQLPEHLYFRWRLYSLAQGAPCPWLILLTPISWQHSVFWSSAQAARPVSCGAGNLLNGRMLYRTAAVPCQQAPWRMQNLFECFQVTRNGRGGWSPS